MTEIRRALRALVAFAIAAHGGDWTMYLRDPAHSSFNSSETILGPRNIATIRPGWTFAVPGLLAAGITVVNGTLYFGDWSGNFHAVEAATGQEQWSTFVGMAAPPDSPACQPAIGVTSQAAVVGDKVYVGGGDSAVYALSRATGEILWRVPLADPASGAYIWSSILPSGGALYVGLASLGDCPLVRGLLARIDPAAPDSPRIRYLYPGDDVGGGVWSTPAIDERTGTIYITTGTGDQDPATGRWGGTFAALDAFTLELKAYFFLPTNNTDADIEWGSSPVLFTPPGGAPLVAATGKDGVLYALRADDLSGVWATQIAIECICPECGCGSISTPAFDGSTLYAGAGVSDPESYAGGTVYAIDPSSGQVLWSYLTDGVVVAPVTVANGLVYASTTAGLNVFDASTGALLWTDGYRGALYSQAVVVDGVVYCSYLNGEVVAWSVPSRAGI